METTAGAPPQQLSRGRHGLSREEVVASQRERMLRAMASAVAERGYARTTVAEVIRRAGVSRATFYEQFSDKDECFLAAHELAVQIVLAAVGEALAAAPDDPVDQIDRFLAAYLEILASEPHFAHTFLIEIYGAGPVALQRRMATQQLFTQAVAQTFGASTDDERFACETMVAAVSGLVTTRIGVGETRELPSLHGPLMDLVERLLGDLLKRRQSGDPQQR